ncbi:anti-sigma factor family protein [Streptomyces sp. NPDC094448]|uniref:anti-sigma factor family protein n=1 Tax=Streptomyces sp. NPDC094448 TaxID=3366063 RepID=UPI003817B28E
MTQHPDVSEISDLTEGLLSPARSAPLRKHLADCELCADVRASLEEIRTLLGVVPGTPRMPADIAERIDAALAAEALLDAGRPEHVSRETSTASGPAEPGTAAGTGTGTATRPAGHPRGATGPGRTGAQRRRRRNSVLGAIVGMTAVGVGAFLFQSGDSGSTPTTQAIASPSDRPGEFSASTLETRVRDLLDRPVPQRDGGNAMATSEQPGSPAGGVPGTELGGHTGTGPEVPLCVQQGTGRTTVPIAVERGRYRGTDAYLLVLPVIGNIQQVEAFVVDAGCTGSSPSDTGELLLTDSFPRR